MMWRLRCEGGPFDGQFVNLPRLQPKFEITRNDTGQKSLYALDFDAMVFRHTEQEGSKWKSN